ncbi:mechanosensitive ion channel family protein [Nannocystis bainbridge]|uniref:Mechanosensitive ion channel family protein n=1 Tax=Nannocystis bainbridge TaxID=2995303 RepID=A0ABT5DZA0_9BACT|nr:mechanosensitive ion channel family protein [Nannocystis bainbridge]MDC0718896.1 mechanosensitive ion channel family protein [Nannocystis bainbridge]
MIEFLTAPMDDAIFPLPQLQWVALEILPKAARGYADVAAELTFALLLGLLLRFIVLPLLVRASAKNEWVIDDIITARLRDRALLWALLGGLLSALPDMPWKARSIAFGEKVTFALLALSVTLTLMRIVSEVVGRNQSPAGGGTTLIKYIINSVLLLLGGGAILGLFGVSVFPALTALGVGGLAVALAFQDTLANVFAGVNLTASRQIRVGDFISVDAKMEGFVADIGWRTTTLRTLDDLLIFIPNKRLGEAMMTNFSRPDPTMWIEVPFRVGLDVDPEALEAILLDEVRKAREVLPGLREVAPAMRLRVGEWSLEVRLFVPIQNFVDRNPLTTAMVKRLLIRLRREGLVIPLPQRVVHVPSATADTSTTSAGPLSAP